MLPLAAMSVFMTPVAVRFIERFGVRSVIIAEVVLLTLAFVVCIGAGLAEAGGGGLAGHLHRGTATTHFLCMTTQFRCNAHSVIIFTRSVE
ncbi:hypothetical protein J2S89_001478 [Arthrobacter bambusae]|nr:hypothetical protein [Arthrobacter bambusae]MDQ0097317.1 hypothetical protein [Arthrobacter bambusae]